MTFSIQNNTTINTALDSVQGGSRSIQQDDVIQQQELEQPEQQQRAACYGLLAAVLRQPPNQDILDYIGQLSGDSSQTADELLLSMSALGLAAGLHDPQMLDDEYHDLFIGLGRGEVVPYGSWYLTGFLQEKPLSDLRCDLSALGFTRSDDTKEPEDHAAALCEIMQMLVSESQQFEVQQKFFNTHLAPWIDRFFADLATSPSAVFYQTVARFGTAFVAFESAYLSMQT